MIYLLTHNSKSSIHFDCCPLLQCDVFFRVSIASLYLALFNFFFTRGIIFHNDICMISKSLQCTFIFMHIILFSSQMQIAHASRWPITSCHVLLPQESGPCLSPSVVDHHLLDQIYSSKCKFPHHFLTMKKTCQFIWQMKSCQVILYNTNDVLYRKTKLQ